jgi:hypothetical protein
MLTPLERLEAWLYKKAPRVLTFYRQFTIMEWLGVIALIILIMETAHGLG